MEINGCTRTCGLIGNPVEHTLSPVIHHFLAEKLDVDLAYVPFLVQKESLGEAVKGAYALNLLGLNVTVPYKSDVIPYLCEVDELAERIGAVNTLVRTEKGYKGYNTDMPGLFRAMQSDDVKLAGERVIVLGAGGVARAVVMMLATKGAKEIIILNRTLERAEKIAEEVNAITGRKLVRAMVLSAFGELPEGEKYLAIQATNVGMYPNTEEVILRDKAFYRRIHTGYDLIFNPADTMFMKLVRESGGRSFNGLKMLLYQGVIAFELWTGKVVAAKNADQLYRIMLEKMQEK